MSRQDKLFNFINMGVFTDQTIENFILDNDITERKIIKKSFAFINKIIMECNLNEYYYNFLTNCILLINILFTKINTNDNEVEANIKRILNIKNNLEYNVKNKNCDEYINLQHQIDNVYINKKYSLSSYICLIKQLIEKKEKLAIISKFIINDDILKYQNCYLFDITFDLATKAIEENSCDIFYYISLLKKLYNSNIDKQKYYKYFITNTNDNSFINELYHIINGESQYLDCDEILNKYYIVPKLNNVSLHLKNKNDSDTKVFTIDGPSSVLRDDGFSIQKDGNNFKIGIHITNIGYQLHSIEKIDDLARNNFISVYNPYIRTTILPNNIQDKFSLTQGNNRNVLSLYVIVNNYGEIKDYYFKEETCKICQNLSYDESEETLNYKINKHLSKDLNQLLIIATCIEDNETKKFEYWNKKEQIKHISHSENYRSNLIMRELMVLYNHLIAITASNNKIPYIYRTNKKEYISKLYETINGKIEYFTKTILNDIYMESEYSYLPKKHYGLGKDLYSHSTNPLRRYPDLYNQYLFTKFYFKGEDDFNYDNFIDLVQYFNQRNLEINLFASEYEKQMKLTKNKS